jgi:hypothetical protein
MQPFTKHSLMNKRRIARIYEVAAIAGLRGPSIVAELRDPIGIFVYLQRRLVEAQNDTMTKDRQFVEELSSQDRLFQTSSYKIMQRFHDKPLFYRYTKKGNILNDRKKEGNLRVS